MEHNYLNYIAKKVGKPPWIPRQMKLIVLPIFPFSFFILASSVLISLSSPSEINITVI